MQAIAPAVGPQARLPLGIDLSLTERQLSMLCDLDQNRFMSTAQFQRLYGQRAVRDLQSLTERGLIEQPEAQWVWRRRKGGGSRKRIHALANPGDAVLRELKLVDRKGRDFTELNRDLSPARFALRVPHQLAVVDVALAFRPGLDARPDPTLRTATTRKLTIPGRERSIFPDKTLIAGRQECLPVVLPVEVDRSTEPNMRRPEAVLDELAEKFELYNLYAESERPLVDFGTPHFHVLTAVSGGEAKMRNVARTAFGICGETAPDRFLVTSLAALEEGDPFEVPWLNAAEEPILLGV